MFAVYCKELRQYAVSVAGAVFLAAYAALTGYYFSVGNLFAQSGSVSSLYHSVLSMLMFLVPVLTMRLMSEERRMRTDQLLLTAPVSIASVVLGKYFAALSVFLLGSLPLLFCTAVLAAYGCAPMLTVCGNVAGLLLTGCAFTAAGLFSSALTESQLVAAIVSYAMLIGLWLIDFVQAYVSSSALVAAIRFVSIRAHFSELASGIFSFSSLVFFSGMAVTLISLTVVLLEQRKSR